MVGVLGQKLWFPSDAGLVLDVALQVAGAPLNLTGALVSMSWALRRDTGGFDLEVSSGILTPGADGIVRARQATAFMGSHIGDYDIGLRVQLPNADWFAWLTFRAGIGQGAYPRSQGDAPLNMGLMGSSAVTVTANLDDDMITVDAQPGVAGASLLQTLQLLGELSASATEADVNAYYIAKVSEAAMSNIFYAAETITVPANSTVYAAYRGSGMTAGNPGPFKQACAKIASDSAIEAFIVFSDDGVSPQLPMQPSNVGADDNAVELAENLAASHFTVGLTNPNGSAAHVTVKSSFNG